MTDKPSEINRPIIIYFIITIAIFLLGRTVAAFVFDNNWSFTHWQHIPIWYLAGLALFSAGIFFLISKKSELLEIVFTNRTKSIVSFSLIFILFIIFQFDSFIYSGGNYRINHIAQVDTIIYRFFEFGAVTIVSLFYKICSLFPSDNNSAGLLSWKLLSYVGTFAALFLSYILSKIIVTDKSKQLFVFILLCFGPHSLLYFGFVGYEPVIVAIIYGFIYLTLRYEQDKKISSIIYLWALTIIGVIFHISLAILLPALLFLTLKIIFKKQNSGAFIGGLLVYAGLLSIVYIVSASNFEFAKYILFPNKMNLIHGYNLFSIKHISDVVQLVFLFFPQVIVLKLLFFKNIKLLFKSILLQTLLLLAIACNTLIVIMEPTHSIILDHIGMTIYLAPLSVMLVVLLKNETQGLKLFAALSIIIPLSVLPVYTNINNAEPHVDEYLQKNHQFYIEAGTALQDSFFYNKDLDRANYWYVNLKKLSRDFLDLTAVGEFTYAEMYQDALRLLHQLKSRYIFWSEPRFQIASIHLRLKRFNLARPEIDSCLFLEPYNKNYLKLDYSYYRDMGNYSQALKAVEKCASIFPNDYEIKTDEAIIYYRMKDINNADLIAEQVINNDSTQAYAYLIRGFVSEIRKNPKAAIYYFEKFVKLAPNEPETPDIRKRLNNLILKQR